MDGREAMSGVQLILVVEAFLVMVLAWWVVQLRVHEREHCGQIGELQDLREYLIRVHGVDRDLLDQAVRTGVLRRDEVTW
jgi:hypothetical protein